MLRKSINVISSRVTATLGSASQRHICTSSIPIPKHSSVTGLTLATIALVIAPYAYIIGPELYINSTSKEVEITVKDKKIERTMFGTTYIITDTNDVEYKISNDAKVQGVYNNQLLFYKSIEVDSKYKFKQYGVSNKWINLRNTIHEGNFSDDIEKKFVASHICSEQYHVPM